MLRTSIIGIFVIALFGCEVAPQTASDAQSGSAENQENNAETPAAESGPTPMPPKPGPGVPAPKPAPPPAQPDTDAGSNAAPDIEADAAATDEGATDEEFEGCGPMGDEPIACEWNYDCPPYDVPWMTNMCVEGACAHDEVKIGFNYEYQGVDSSKLCVVIYRLRADGWWHGEEHELPYVTPLSKLCPSFEEDAYISPQIADVVLEGTKRLEFAIVPCAGPQDENLVYKLPPSGLKIQQFPEYMMNVYNIGVSKDPLGGFLWSYIKGLGATCWAFNNVGKNLYVWD